MSSIVHLKGGWGSEQRYSTGSAELAGIGSDAILSQMAIPLLVLGRDLRCVATNPAMASLYGRPTRALVGKSVTELVPGSAAAARRAFELLDGGSIVPEHEVGWNGHRYQLAVSPWREASGELRAIIITATDITRRFRTEERLRQSRRRLVDYAHHDHLTGLLNRRGLDAKLRRQLSIACREGKPLSILIADIDWFKAYNDRLGHLAGDQCLRLVASELRHAVQRAGGEIGRYGGEEFVAILPGADSAKAQRIADYMRSAVLALALDHPTSGHGWTTISVGVAVLESGHGVGFDEAVREKLLGAADDALYLAKVNGRNQARVFRTTPKA